MVKESWQLDTTGWPLLINSSPDDKAPIIASVNLPEGSAGDDKEGLAALARARLMVAAPDLLEALKKALTVVDAVADGRAYDVADMGGHVATVVAEAIRKAEGR